jgi:hypothetical protein
MYYIKIDPKSVKKNPNAGTTSCKEYLNSLASLTIEGEHESIENDYIRMVSCGGSMSGNKDYSSTYTYMASINNKNSEEFEALLSKLVKKFKDRFTYTIINNYQEINFIIPESPYFFEYKKTKVKCTHCSAKFYHTELVDEDGNYDYDEENYLSGRSSVCPKCDKEDCCEITYQIIGDYLLEKEGKPKFISGGG